MAIDIKKSINSYLEHLKALGQVSGLTVANYQNYLTRFSEWYIQNAKRTNLNITEKILSNYSNYLKKLRDEKNQALSISTQNYYLIALRSYIKYLADQKLISFDFKKIKLAVTPKSEKDIISSAAINNLLTAPLKTKEDDLIKKRDLAILHILINSGLKVSELNLLKRQTFTAQEIISLKNSKGRTINIQFDEKTCQLINDYLTHRHDTDSALLISHDRAGRADKRLNKKSFALTPRSIQRIIQHYGKLSGLKNKITPSYLRYLYGHQLLSQGETINKVKTLLGHAHTNTTKLYQ